MSIFEVTKRLSDVTALSRKGRVADIVPEVCCIGRHEAREGVKDERGTGTSWYTQGRVRSDVGRKARTLGCQWPPLRRLGDLPSQGFSRGPKPALCVADQRLVRAGDPALQRRGQDMGAGG